MSQDNTSDKELDDLNDPDIPVVVVTDGGFDDQSTPEVTETSTEPQAPEGAEEEPTEEETINLVAANNTRTSYNVNLTYPVYRLRNVQPNDKTPALTVVPKRFHRLVPNDQAWVLSPEDAANAKSTQYLENWMFGLTTQPVNSFHKEKGWYERSLDNPESEWTQGLEEGGTLIEARRPSLQKPTTPRILKGQAARERAARGTGVGITTRVPLPHTGVHFRLLPRSSQDYIDLDYQIAMDRIRTGRDTIGLIFQNSHIYHVKRVWEFILESTADINIQQFGDVDPGDFVRVTDLPILQWGMACTMFPDGYRLELPCSSGIQICTHTEVVTLDLDKLLFINGRGLSKSQRTRLANAGHKRSPADLEEYQNNFISPFTRRVPISDNCEFVLKVPTVNEYIKAGTEWIEALTQTAIGLFGDDETTSEDRVRGYVARAITMASLREYSHWISEIIWDKYDSVPEREDIEENLRTISATPELADKALKTIQEFIEDCTIALIAIPNFSCPKCEADYLTDEHSKHPELIPLDMLKHFFQVKDLRLALHRQEPER